MDWSQAVTLASPGFSASLRTATADDFADDAVYGVNQAQTLIPDPAIIVLWRTL